MKVSLIISTYNFPKALNLCLQAVLRQTLMPDEVLIADDGSDQETRSLIEHYRSIFPMQLKHLWHEDKGFRKSKILNAAIREAMGEYIVQIDGDIVMDSRFIEDHLRFAAKGFFLTGSRVLVGEELTHKAMQEEAFSPSLFTCGLHHRENALRLPWLTPLFFSHRRVNGCNMSFWREDLFAINGYDEAMEGWGAEDTDLADRLKRNDVKQKHIKYMAIQYHLHHNIFSRASLREHENKLQQNQRNGIVRCKQGLISE